MSIVIEMNHVTKTYHRKIKNGKGIFKNSTFEAKEAIKDISFQIKEGELVGLVGLNGAGKSTLIKSMLGILSPDCGEAKIFGQDSFRFRKKNAVYIGANFGQKSSLVWDLPFKYSLELNKKIYQVSDERYEEILEELEQFLQIGELLNVPVRTMSLGQRMKCEFAAITLHSPRLLILDETTIGLDIVIKKNIEEYLKHRTMSLGQRMKCEFAAITLHSPRLLILDETTIGLDIVIKKNIEEYLKHINAARNVTILFSSHDLAELERICDRIMIINSGEIILDDQVRNISDLSRYSYMEIKFAEEFDGNMEIVPGLQIIEYLEDGLKIRIDKQVLSEKEAMTELIDKMPVENISIEKQSLEDFIYNLVQK